MGGEVAASLAPGFRFHPTDEELVSYYLKRKVYGKPFRFDAISEIDLYKSAPWDLPGQSRLKSRDLEWYFFCALDRKYGNGSKTNRATQQGYWKTTGKDRPVRRNDRTVGMKKTLVFHIGKAPRGERTNWVMHEYRLVDEQLGQTGVSLNIYVLCRIFQKSGSGPKNGAQYGAPLIEEEWDEDVFVPQSEVPDETFYDIRDEGYFEQNDLEQNLEMDIPFENIALPSSSSHGIASNNVENFIEDDPKFFIGPVDRDYFPELSDDQKFFDLSEQHLMNPSPAINEYFVELNDLVNPVHVNYLADEPREEMEYLDTSHNQPIGDISFPETDNISIPVNTDPLGFDILDEYLTYFDAIDDNLEYVDQNSFKISAHEDPNLGQLTLRQEGKEEFENLFLESPQLVKAYGSEGEGASSSKKKPESTQLAQDFKSDDGWDNNTLSKRVNRLLDSISAPPAFAAEFPTKEAVLGQNLEAQSSGSIHFTTQMIRIRSTGINGDMNEWSLGKSGDVEYILHHGMRSGGDVVASEPSVNLESMGNILSCKAGSAMVRCGLYFVFLWVLILSVSFKIGCHFYISFESKQLSVLVRLWCLVKWFCFGARLKC